MGKYEIIKKYIDGVRVTGYVVKDENNEQRLLKYSDVVNLAKSGSVKNARTVVDNDTLETYICILGNEEDIEIVYKRPNRKLKLVARILSKEGANTGYVAKDESGKQYKLGLTDSWTMAKNGCIEGFKGVTVNGNKAIIRNDDGESLGELTVLTS